MVAVPEAFRAFGRWQREGEAGRLWLAALPKLAAQYCDQWGLRIDGEPMHGGNGIAIPVSRDGESLVLKLDWPDILVDEQIQALRVWHGRGMVLLIDAAPADGVLLLERLDSRLSLRDLPLEQAVPLIGQMLRRLAVPAPGGFRTTRDAAIEMHGSLRDRWDAAGRPFAAGVLNAAVGLAGDLAVDRPSVLVNRDLYYDHVLRGRREPWLASHRPDGPCRVHRVPDREPTVDAVRRHGCRRSAALVPRRTDRRCWDGPGTRLFVGGAPLCRLLAVGFVRRVHRRPSAVSADR